MEDRRNLRLLDERGNPLSARIESAISRLVPRFRKRFPTLRDDEAVAKVFEQAGQQIDRREQRGGPIDKLHAYTWVTLQNAARSWLRRGPNRLTQRTLGSRESEVVLATMSAAYGTPDQIEQAILFEQVAARLSAPDRLILSWKKAGFTSEEIAERRGSSRNAVDLAFSRIVRKTGSLLRVQENVSARRDQAVRPNSKTPTGQSLDETDIKKDDDESIPAPRSARLRTRR